MAPRAANSGRVATRRRTRDKAARVYTPPAGDAAAARRGHKAARVYDAPGPGTVPRRYRGRRAAAEPVPAAVPDAGADPAAGATGSQPPAAVPAPPPARGGGARPGQALGGAITGLFAWAFAINWIRGGQAQAFGWFGAKFFNEPYAAASSPAPATPAPVPAPGGRQYTAT